MNKDFFIEWAKNALEVAVMLIAMATVFGAAVGFLWLLISVFPPWLSYVVIGAMIVGVVSVPGIAIQPTKQRKENGP